MKPRTLAKINWQKISLCLLAFCGSVFFAQAQEQTGVVNGLVRSESGKPLSSVSVLATNLTTGLTSGAQTDSSGVFNFTKLPAKGRYSFAFTSIGFESQTLSGYAIKGGGSVSIIIRLKEQANTLDEVVVVGYGTQRRGDLTGAVAQVSGAVLQNRSIPNVTQGLQGEIPNLNLVMMDGKPIQSPTYNIRGTTSIGAGGGTSLVLIDGIEGDPSLLNPNDIETVTVLKDASSSAIYGARAAFGVVLITTKVPKKGRSTLTYSADYSTKKPTTVPKIVSNGFEYAQMFDSAWSAWNDYSQVPQNINKTQAFSQAYMDEYAQVNANPSLPKTQIVNGSYVYYGNTNWYDLLYKNSEAAIDQNLSISGGSDKATYYVTGRYYGQDGLFRYNTDKYHMYNLMAKGSIEVTSWLTVNDNLQFSSRFYHNPENVEESGGIWRNMADEGHPSSMLLNPDGSLTYSSASTVGDFYYGKNGLDFNDNVIKNTAAFTARFFQNKLQIKGDFTFENTDSTVKETQVPVPYSPAPGVTDYVGASTNDIRENYNQTNYIATNLYGQYESRFGKDHYFKAMVGYNYEQSVFNALSAQRNGLVYSNATDISLAQGTNITTSGGYDKWAILGGFSRLNYSYKDRYLVEFDGRYDGSSKFPSDQRYAFFPSGSAGWRLSKEAFWNVSPRAVSDLKIRGSYGSLGNGSIASYLYQQNFAIQESNFIINGVRPQQTGQPNVLPNGLTWERATTKDVGIDASFLSSRLSFTGDGYVRNTDNMFTVGKTLPAVFGTSVPFGNYANMNTKGWEASIAWTDQFRVARKPLHYNIAFWMSDYSSTITQYNNATKSLTDYYAGEKTGEIWGYTNDGYWTAANVGDPKTGAKATQAIFQASTSGQWLPGDIKYKDLNGDGVVNNGNNTATNPGDMKIIGNSTPRYAFGFKLGGDWNNFFVSTFFQGIGKEKWWPGAQDDEFWGQYNRPYEYLLQNQIGKIWEPNNPNAYFPRYRGYVAQNGTTGELVNPQTKYLQNVAYIRLKNIQVGYNLPERLIKKTGFSSARVYLSGENLWSWSPFYKITRNIDPESIQQSDVILTGTSSSGNANNYPILKSMTVGMSLTL
jgi:TonB-linked SusC/RagA family outer membrane protein